MAHGSKAHYAPLGLLAAARAACSALFTAATEGEGGGGGEGDGGTVGERGGGAWGVDAGAGACACPNWAAVSSRMPNSTRPEIGRAIVAVGGCRSLALRRQQTGYPPKRGQLTSAMPAQLSMPDQDHRAEVIRGV